METLKNIPVQADGKYMEGVQQVHFSQFGQVVMCIGILMGGNYFEAV